MLAMAMPGHNDSTASNGWLEAWQKRHSVKWAALCGEAAEVPEDVVAEWTMCLSELTAGYLPADIYNADETGLYYCALPERSMVIRGDPRKGIKMSKERVTVLRREVEAASDRQVCETAVFQRNRQGGASGNVPSQGLDDRHPLQGVVRETEQFRETARTEHPAFRRQLCGTRRLDDVECQDGVFTTKHHISPATV